MWQRSNPFAICEELQASLDLVGRAYLKIEENHAGEVTSFYTLPAHRMRRVLTKDRREVDYFQLSHGGRRYVIQPDELLEVREYAPGLSLDGIAPFRAAVASYVAGAQTQALQSDMVRKGGEFAGVLVSPDARGAINDPVKQRRLNLQFKKRYRRAHSRRTPIALPSGVKLEKTQLTPAEMRLPELSRLSREQIYEVYGIPLWLVGLQGGDNLGAGGAARSSERMFWEHTMDSLMGRLGWALTIGLLQRFDESWHCRFDTSGVYCLQVAFLERAELVQKACGRAVLTVNEGREILKKQPFPDAKWDELQDIPAPGAGGDVQVPGSEDPTATDAADATAAKPEKPKPSKKPKMEPAYSARSRDERRHHLTKAMDREARHAQRYVVRLFNQQEARLIARIPEQRATGTRVVDLVALLSESPEDRELMLDMVTDLVERRGQDALSELIQGADFKSTNARVGSYITSQANRALSGTSETTRKLLNERMAEVAGESMEGLIAVVRGVFDDRRENAVTIARTESASAFNFSTIEAWRQTDGLVTGKRWVAILDEHTRPEHAEADGQEAGLDDGFQVGGELLQFPGDPDASPDLTVNCRCTVDFVLSSERSSKAMLEYINRAMGRGTPSRNGHGNSRIAAIFERSK